MFKYSVKDYYNDSRYILLSSDKWFYNYSFKDSLYDSYNDLNFPFQPPPPPVMPPPPVHGPGGPLINEVKRFKLFPLSQSYKKIVSNIFPKNLCVHFLLSIHKSRVRFSNCSISLCQDLWHAFEVVIGGREVDPEAAELLLIELIRDNGHIFM